MAASLQERVRTSLCMAWSCISVLRAVQGTAEFMKSASTPILFRLASNSTWMLMERGIALVTAVAVGLYFVRYLGPEDFGVYSYALGLYGLFATASRLGINALVVNETVQVGPKQSTILGSAFTLRMIASVLCI